MREECAAKHIRERNPASVDVALLSKSQNLLYYIRNEAGASSSD